MNNLRDTLKKTIRANPEFASELVCIIPYAYWLHSQDLLEKVVVSKGMKPFYYFCDDVREEFTHRDIDGALAGLNELPNNWIHHNVGDNYSKLSNEEKFILPPILSFFFQESPLLLYFFKFIFFLISS